MLSTALDRNPAVRTRRRVWSATEQALRQHACSDRRPVGEITAGGDGRPRSGLIAALVFAGINPGSRRWVKPGLPNIITAVAMADGATAPVDLQLTCAAASTRSGVGRSGTAASGVEVGKAAIRGEGAQASTGR